MLHNAATDDDDDDDDDDDRNRLQAFVVLIFLGYTYIVAALSRDSCFH